MYPTSFSVHAHPAILNEHSLKNCVICQCLCGFQAPFTFVFNFGENDKEHRCVLILVQVSD
jgi:hypothetical protein